MIVLQSHCVHVLVPSFNLEVYIYVGSLAVSLSSTLIPQSRTASIYSNSCLATIKASLQYDFISYFQYFKIIFILQILSTFLLSRNNSTNIYNSKKPSGFAPSSVVSLLMRTTLNRNHPRNNFIERVCMFFLEKNVIIIWAEFKAQM